MKDQVVMSKSNGQLAIAIPLYRINYEESLGKLEGYSLMMTNAKPLAYVIYCFDQCTLMNHEWVHRNLEFLGDL